MNRADMQFVEQVMRAAVDGVMEHVQQRDVEIKVLRGRCALLEQQLGIKHVDSAKAPTAADGLTLTPAGVNAYGEQSFRVETDADAPRFQQELNGRSKPKVRPKATHSAH